jgi:hypothetical protein
MTTRIWMVLRRLGELRAAVGDARRMLAAEVQEAARREREDPAEAEHEVRTDDDAIVATFRGPVPRVGEYVWTDAGAWRVTTVAWWVRSSPHRSCVARACVYVEPLRPGSRPNPGV